MNQTFEEHERQMECAEAEDRLQNELFATSYLMTYFGYIRMKEMQRRLGLDGCYDIAAAISEVET